MIRMGNAPDNNINRIANYRALFIIALGLMIGIASCGLLVRTGVLLLAILLVVIGCVLIALNHPRWASFFLAILAGLLIAFISLPNEFESGSANVSGIITDYKLKNDTRIYVLSSAKINGESFNKKIELTLYDNSEEFAIGDLIECEAKVRKPGKVYETYNEFFSKLANGTGCIAYGKHARFVSGHNAPFTEFVFRIRNAVDRRIKLAFGEDSGLFSALIIGNKSEVGEERYSVFRSAGTSHLLAISGFHMGIVAGLIGLMIPRRRKTLRLVVITAAMAAYCTIAAYAPGFVRAAVMAFFALASDRLGRQGDGFTALSAAAIFLLIVNPYQLYSVGFQLSFSACFGLILLSRSIKACFKKIRFPDKIASASAASIAAMTGTFALQMRYYNSFTPYALIANLIAIPAFAVIIVLGLAAVVIAFVSPAAAQVFSFLPRGVLFVTEKFLMLLSKLPFSNLEFKSPSLLCCVLWLAALFAASEYVLRPKVKRFALAAGIIVIFTITYVIGIIKP